MKNILHKGVSCSTLSPEIPAWVQTSLKTPQNKLCFFHLILLLPFVFSIRIVLTHNDNQKHVVLFSIISIFTTITLYKERNHLNRKLVLKKWIWQWGRWSLIQQSWFCRPLNLPVCLVLKSLFVGVLLLPCFTSKIKCLISFLLGQSLAEEAANSE